MNKSKINLTLTNKSIEILIFFCLLSFLSGCCTAIGFGLGKAIDNNKSGQIYAINEKLYGITPGTNILIITTSNDTISGLFEKINNEYSDNYIDQYNQKYEDMKRQLSVPQIGDTLFITNPLGDVYKYIFLGFGHDAIYVQSTLSNKNLFIKLFNTATIQTTNDYTLSIEQIQDAIKFKVIPIMSRIHIHEKQKSNSVFLHNVHLLNRTSTNATRWLTAIGIASDLFFWFNLEKSGDRLKFKWD